MQIAKIAPRPLFIAFIALANSYFVLDSALAVRYNYK